MAAWLLRRCGQTAPVMAAVGKSMSINSSDIRKKFGDDYQADEQTYCMGIDQRFTRHFAERFKGQRVFETCTGAGFTTISIAKVAKSIVTFDIEPKNQLKAIHNAERAGVSNNVTFIEGSSMDGHPALESALIDSAFLDPDWAVTGPDHKYRFLNSTTQPPADQLLDRVLKVTPNVALVLPPFVDRQEFADLPEHELETLYLDGEPALFCLYFGQLLESSGETEFRIPK